MSDDRPPADLELRRRRKHAMFDVLGGLVLAGVFILAPLPDGWTFFLVVFALTGAPGFMWLLYDREAGLWRDRAGQPADGADNGADKA